MIQIESVEISYFRSIYYLKLTNMKDLSVLSGKNDSGKSNVLKAINLFFNNETDWQTALDFYKDFSGKRLEEVRKDTIKGKQFIRVKIHFIRGNRAARSLPPNFWVAKTWHRDSKIPEVKSSIPEAYKAGKTKASSEGRALSGLQQFQNSIRFEYVPAVKDRSFYRYSLGLLQDTILRKKSHESGIVEAVESLNSTVEEAAKILSEEFMQVSRVQTQIKLPHELATLFRAFSIDTKNGEAELPLIMRGDGIQSRFIPSLLHYISLNSKFWYMWGFEEPENCLEHSLSTELANEIKSNYCKSVQILLTSHSPAFISLTGENTSIYRIYSEDGSTNCLQLQPPTRDSADGSVLLKNELGLMQFEKEKQEQYEKLLSEIEQEKIKLDKLCETIKQSQNPILLTEGRADVKILESAWEKLYPETTRHFRIISCDPLIDGQSCGGTGMLSKALESCRPDQPKTIGLFDRDEEGIKHYNELDKNFRQEGNIKIHRNSNAAAFLIPDAHGKEQYIEAKNLPIEFLFPDDKIIAKVNEQGLTLKQKKRVTKVGRNIQNEEETTEPFHRQVVDGKVIFAEKVVPTFSSEAFKNFKRIFEQFELILEKMNGE